MKLLIDIPKEFEQHFQTDGFKDSLHRLSADAHLLAGNYEQETAVMLIEAFASAVPVPPHYDLIDHNALKIAVMDCDAETRIDFLKHAMDCINKAPVVIPSDIPTYEAKESE